MQCDNRARSSLYINVDNFSMSFDLLYCSSVTHEATVRLLHTRNDFVTRRVRKLHFNG